MSQHAAPERSEALPLEVHKFGGSSLASADRMREALDRIAEVREAARPVVVVSALGGVTDTLLALSASLPAGSAHQASADVDALRRRHHQILTDLISEPTAEQRTALDALCDELEALLQGARLLSELTPRTRDRIVATGEKLSARIVAAALGARGIPAEALDADRFLETDGQFGAATPLGPVAHRTLAAALWPVLAAGSVPVVTGFCGRAPDGATTTLGRGGSDLTATLLAAALEARSVTLWSDVDGVFSADPRIVPEARPIAQLHYREAAEMSFYGAKVLHQRTMIPVLPQAIPVWSRNTGNPAAPGTVVDGRFTPGSHPVKAVTAVRGHALLSIEGKGMVGVPGIAARVFGCLAERGISVTMISQSSSEASICLAVPAPEADAAERALRNAFRPELARGDIEEINRVPAVGLVAAVGLGMARTPGVAARLFSALADAHVNVLAIAQGSTELNITFAVTDPDVAPALRTVHRAFGLHRIDTGLAQPGGVDLVLIGFGQIGRELLGMVQRQQEHFRERFGGPARVVAVSDRSGFVLASQGLSPERLTALAAAKAAGAPLARQPGGRPGTAADGVTAALAYRLARPIVVDVSDGDESAEALTAALALGADVVTANKKPLAGPLSEYAALCAARDRTGRILRAEATVGAGLPVIDTLEMLLAAGDRLLGATGCFSGTLNYVLSELEADVPFSAAVAAAREQGFTEPDPVVDLAGTDVARKAVILGRLSGLAPDETSLELTGLVDPDWAGLPWSELQTRLATRDAAFSERVAAARAQGRVLRYVAEVRAGVLRVGLEAVDAASPLGQLRGTDNMIVFTTSRYADQPLVIRGPGAGVAVTAAGVLGDILRIAQARS